MIYLLHFNNEYTESTEAHPTRAAAVDAVADAFGIDAEWTGKDTPEFWEAVDAHYAAGDWKGFTFQTLDPSTLQITDAHKPDPFDADNLPESYGFRVDMGSAFRRMAGAALTTRAHDLAIGQGGYSWVLWDPQDDADGLLFLADNPQALRRDFAEHARAHFDPPTKSA